MPGLILNSAGTDRIFRSDGKVATTAPDGSEQKRGEWTSAPARDANRIHYTFDEVEQPEFDVSYFFNDDNQLVARIPAANNGGSDSAPYPFAGRIKIDDNHDVAYELFDETGDSTCETIVVHGDLSFQQLDKLTLTLPGGQTTQILGDDETGQRNLEPKPNAVAGGGGDLITFSATTSNMIDGEARATRAIILFTGHWGVNENGLVFNAGLTAGEVKIQFGGTYKGVTAGLDYYAKDGEQEIAFTIHGEHQFKRPSGGEGSVNWLMSLGHSKQKIEAVARLEVKSQDAAGNKLTLAGDFQFAAQPGQTAPPPKMAISLEATYQTQGSQLVFAADFQKNDDRSSYNLRLDGKYELRNGEVTFSVQLQKTAAGDQELKVSLGSVFENEKLKAHLEAVISKSGSGKIDFSLNFNIRARWVNGELMKIEKPEPA
jgi:hypothetical protein